LYRFRNFSLEAYSWIPLSKFIIGLKKIRKGDKYIMGMLDGKAAIITGSGRGIGSATARLLGEQGASVAVSDLDPLPAEETAGAIRNAGGKKRAGS
jgi:hypothetical protein